MQIPTIKMRTPTTRRAEDRKEEGYIAISLALGPCCRSLGFDRNTYVKISKPSYVGSNSPLYTLPKFSKPDIISVSEILRTFGNE